MDDVAGAHEDRGGGKEVDGGPRLVQAAVGCPSADIPLTRAVAAAVTFGGMALVAGDVVEFVCERLVGVTTSCTHARLADRAS